jgi:hypothetical protein
LIFFCWIESFGIFPSTTSFSICAHYTY